MSGWIRCESDGWARARMALREAGISLPRDLAILDLRHLDDRGDIPSRPRLAERWGWTDKRVRLLLASEAEWRDPLRNGEPKGPTKGRRRAVEGPTKGRSATDETPTIRETGPAEGRRRAVEGPTKGHTRGDPPSPSPSHPDLPLPPPGGSASESRTQWLTDRLLADLDASSRTEALAAVDRWRAAKAKDIDAILSLTRRRKDAKGVWRRSMPDVPEGLRRAEVAAALRRAAERWREPPPEPEAEPPSTTFDEYAYAD